VRFFRILEGASKQDVDFARRMGAPARALDALKRGEATLTHKPKLAKRLAAGAATMGGLALHLGDGFLIVPKLEGAALGSGAVYARNLPAPGTFQIEPGLFAAKTSKNRMNLPASSHPGFDAQVNFRIPAVGVVARCVLMFEGTYTSTATPATVTRRWPWGLAKSVIVSANGINQLFALDGMDLRALMRIRRAKHFFDRESSFAIPGASAAGTVRLFWELPLAFDESLIGGVFAQTEENHLSVTVTTASQAELFSANAGAFSNANWRLIVEFYSIPSQDTDKGRVLVLPDITQLHGAIAREDALTAVGDHVAPLTRTGGILLRLLQRIDNTDAGNVDPTASVTQHAFRYGGNVVPVQEPGSAKRFENETDYGDAVLPAIDAVSGGNPPAYMVDDFVIDNPLRDAIHMLGITEAQAINTIAAGTTINAGAKVRTVQESMVAG
jgi:hypothetical protein